VIMIRQNTDISCHDFRLQSGNMRANRLISILILLQKRRKITALQLAAEMEVSVRTVYRDILAMNMAGIPIYTDRGPGGGISLLESYRTSLSGLLRDEVRALFASSIPPALNELGLGQEWKAALLKLSSILPASLRDDESSVRQRVYVDLGETKNPQQSAPFLNSIHRAIWEDHKLFLTYRLLIPPWIEPLQVEVEPYGLVAHDHNWYVVAKKSDHFLVILIDTIQDVQILEKTFTRPDQFNLASFWKTWWRENQKQFPSYPVKLRFSPEIEPSLARILGKTHLDKTGLADVKGWFVAIIEFDTIHDARRRLLPLGGAVEVLEPLPLRLSMADYAKQIRERYLG
jgi:predicted DNA-binding transcriptional regulator YafY